MNDAQARHARRFERDGSLLYWDGVQQTWLLYGPAQDRPLHSVATYVEGAQLLRKYTG